MSAFGEAPRGPWRALSVVVLRRSRHATPQGAARAVLLVRRAVCSFQNDRAGDIVLRVPNLRGVVGPIVEQLKECCKHFPTRSMWGRALPAAPSHPLGERLALEGSYRLIPRFVTELDLPLAVGVPYLATSSIGPFEEELGPAV